MLAVIFFENCGHFYQKNESSYLGVIHGNFTILDDEKEADVIKRMKQSAEKVASISKECQNISHLHKICNFFVVSLLYCFLFVHFCRYFAISKYPLAGSL